MPLLHSKQQLLLPVNPLFVFATLGLAVLLNCFPWVTVPFVPDFVGLVLVFWAIHQPRLVSMGSGFVLGLLMDVVYTTTLGQCALAYVILAYMGNAFSTRILSFGLKGQMFHVFPMLLLSRVIFALIGFVITGQWVELLFFGASLTGAILWPICDLILLAPQRRAIEKDENRPI